MYVVEDLESQLEVKRSSKEIWSAITTEILFLAKPGNMEKIPDIIQLPNLCVIVEGRKPKCHIRGVINDLRASY